MEKVVKSSLAIRTGTWVNQCMPLKMSTTLNPFVLSISLALFIYFKWSVSCQTSHIVLYENNGPSDLNLVLFL